MIKKRIIAFDLEPQPLHSFSIRGPQRSKVIAPDAPQERYYVDPCRPPRPVAHENIADYMQVAAPRKPTKRLQSLKEGQPDFVQQQILKKQVEALLSGQRSHTLRPLRLKLVQMALALAENARIWHHPTIDQKRAESELSVSEIQNDALVYETVVSPTGYTYRRPRKASDDELEQETDLTATAPAASTEPLAADAAATNSAPSTATASNTAISAADASHEDSASVGLSYNEDDDFDVPYTDDDYYTTAVDPNEDSAYAAMMQSAVEASVRAYESTSSVSGTYTDVEHSFSSISGAEASEAIAQSATSTSTTQTSVVAGEAAASIAVDPHKKRGRPRKIRPEKQAATAATTDTASASTAAAAHVDDSSATSEIVAPNALQTLESLATHTATRKRGRPRKIRPEEQASFAATTDAATAIAATTDAASAIVAAAPVAAQFDENPATPVPARKRGRPRKIRPEEQASFAATTDAATAIAATTDAATAIVAAAPVAAQFDENLAIPVPARKRGRPRKIRPEEQAAIASTIDAATAIAATTDAASAIVAAAPVAAQLDESLAIQVPARKRGRPRKIRPEEQASIAATTDAAIAAAAKAPVAHASSEFAISDDAQSLWRLAAPAPTRKRGHPRKIRREDTAAFAATTDSAAFTATSDTAAFAAVDVAHTSSDAVASSDYAAIAATEHAKKRGRPRKIKPAYVIATESMDVSDTANAVSAATLLITSASAPVTRGSDTALVITKAEDIARDMQTAEPASQAIAPAQSEVALAVSAVPSAADAALVETAGPSAADAAPVEAAGPLADAAPVEAAGPLADAAPVETAVESGTTPKPIAGDASGTASALAPAASGSVSFETKYGRVRIPAGGLTRPTVAASSNYNPAYHCSQGSSPAAPTLGRTASYIPHNRRAQPPAPEKKERVWKRDSDYYLFPITPPRPHRSAATTTEVRSTSSTSDYTPTYRPRRNSVTATGADSASDYTPSYSPRKSSDTTAKTTSSVTDLNPTYPRTPGAASTTSNLPSSARYAPPRYQRVQGPNKTKAAAPVKEDKGHRTFFDEDPYLRDLEAVAALGRAKKATEAAAAAAAAGGTSGTSGTDAPTASKSASGDSLSKDQNAAKDAKAKDKTESEPNKDTQES